MSETISTWCPLISLIAVRQGKGRKGGRKKTRCRSEAKVIICITHQPPLTVIALASISLIFHAILLISLAVYKSLGANTCIVSPQTWKNNPQICFIWLFEFLIAERCLCPWGFVYILTSITQLTPTWKQTANRSLTKISFRERRNGTLEVLSDALLWGKFHSGTSDLFDEAKTKSAGL